MLIAGTQQKSTTFVLNDTQIMHESFLEDVNNILNTGEITNLYSKEDLEQMQDSGLNQILSQKKIPINKDSIYQEFVECLRDSFHIILCMSPVGEQLRGAQLEGALREWDGLVKLGVRITTASGVEAVLDLLKLVLNVLPEVRVIQKLFLDLLL